MFSNLPENNHLNIFVLFCRCSLYVSITTEGFQFFSSDRPRRLSPTKIALSLFDLNVNFFSKI